MRIFIKPIILTGLVAIASAQYSIDPNSVPIATRDAWCESEIAQCPLICLQSSAHSSETRDNDCVAKTLTYSCVCSNGISPNVSQYSLTLPYYICQEWGNQCVAACGQDNACSSACREDHPCGAQDPKRVNTTTTAPGSHPATSTPKGGYSGFADGHSSAGTRNTAIYGYTISDHAVKATSIIMFISIGAVGFAIGL